MSWNLIFTFIVIYIFIWIRTCIIIFVFDVWSIIWIKTILEKQYKLHIYIKRGKKKIIIVLWSKSVCEVI